MFFDVAFVGPLGDDGMAMKRLAKSKPAGVRKARAATSVDEALHLTPEPVLESLLGDPREWRDLFDTDMFPEGLTKPLSKAARRRLDAEAEREYQAWKKKNAGRRRHA